MENLDPSTGELFSLVAPVPTPRTPKYRIRKPQQRSLRPYFNVEDLKMVRDVVRVFTPVLLPQKLKNRFRGPFELEEAVTVYVLRVELEWEQRELVKALGWNKHVLIRHVKYIEDIRTRYAWIERICDKVRGYANGLHL